MTEWCYVAVSCGTHGGDMVLLSLLERIPNSRRIQERQSLSAQACDRLLNFIIIGVRA
jgi:hypothetical protein